MLVHHSEGIYIIRPHDVVSQMTVMFVVMRTLNLEECHLQGRRWRQHVPPKRRIIINPHGITSMLIVFFVATAM
jgi:hypothetical protein